MIITIDSKDINALFDNFGNIYFSFLDKIYELVIDSKNKINIELTNLIFSDLTASNINKNKLTVLEKKLKNKIIDTNNLHNEIINSDIDIYDRYFFENSSIHIENIDNNSDIDEEFVHFSGDSNTYIFNNDDCDDSDVPTYDTILYNNNKPVLKTTLFNINPIYRLNIYNDGNLNFRAIGNIPDKYKLIICNDFLTII